MSHLPNRNLIVNIDKNDFNLHHHVNLPKMALTAADSELWATEFVQGLIDNDYLEQSAMEKLRVARQLALDGPVINV
ncbi:hypothetical protein N0V84_002202 [Fusarium piperis]|uniref:Uncharacterized protein n=1 Tax=Fusarium piperis TaxID=1435070 RepID=A0A9W8WJX3_9HYPO|nr:hypothetical protein N0V84_002202 [Fusarium piperis]